jgi:hypothetical protein
MAKNSARRCATDFGRFVADSETVAGIARASRDNFSERYHLISVACGRQGRLPGVRIPVAGDAAGMKSANPVLSA